MSWVIPGALLLLLVGGMFWYAGTRSSDPPASTSLTAPGDYRVLAIGDSIPAGFTPESGSSERDQSYAALVTKELGKQSEGTVQLDNLACPGETATSAITKGLCAYSEGNQLGAALARARDDGPEIRLVTIQLGANDVWPCSAKALGVDTKCGERGVVAASVALDGIIGEIQHMLPDAQIVVVDYYDPFASMKVFGDDSAQWAELSSHAVSQLNERIARVASDRGVTLARIGELFHVGDWSMSETGDVPLATDRVCRWTFMCERGDTHPSDEGHQAIAHVVGAAIGVQLPQPDITGVSATPTATPTFSDPWASPPPAAIDPSPTMTLPSDEVSDEGVTGQPTP